MMYSEKSILIIDDDTWMRRLLSKIFSKMNITDLYLATDGFEGINLAIEKKPDAIFLDMMMPEIEGLMVLKLLKSINRTKNIPVIIITGNSDYETLGSVLSFGATQFVAKPFTYTTVMEKLDSVFVNLDSENHKSKEDNEIISGDDDDDFFFQDLM